MPATRKDVIEWQFRCLTEVRDSLSDKELNWLIIMEDYYKLKGDLTDRYMEVLDDIYRRH